MAISEVDLQHLRRCVELARIALDDDASPFGSILIDADGKTLYEDRNRCTDNDLTQHPEFAIARWAGLGRIVYATSSAQLWGWLAEWHAPVPPVAPLSITTVVPSAVVSGPAPELEEEMKSLYAARFRS
ncbi:cytidine/deoxycytidylate deaminase family protein [Mycobacterium branderi]|uniref:tRNA-specific adenosine deaminase n=1 Tax=Mycobacterium branderi TaxID=43348 RepID=A0AA91LXA0_9MYCO|nr:nucleoside deaminase [Mycobacterium branderi]ORA36899.1 tRNA-specific adenosine deaminase [Mycobacterium branderi]